MSYEVMEQQWEEGALALHLDAARNAELAQEEKDLADVDSADKGGGQFAPPFSENKDPIDGLLDRARVAIQAGEDLPLNTPAGQMLKVRELVGSGSKFFENIFMDSMKSMKKGESVLTLRNKNPALYRQIMWRSMLLLRDHVAKYKIPFEVFSERTLSFNNGNTIQYFGSGVVQALDVLRKREGLEAPKIHWGGIQYIASNMSIFHGHKGNEPREGILKENIYKEDSSDMDKLPGVVYACKGIRAFNGVKGEFTYEGEREKFLYMLPEKSYTNATSYSALANYPVSFLKRKFKNAIYKHLFGDLGIDVEVTEERGAHPYLVVPPNGANASIESGFSGLSGLLR